MHTNIISKETWVNDNRYVVDSFLNASEKTAYLIVDESVANIKPATMQELHDMYIDFGIERNDYDRFKGMFAVLDVLHVNQAYMFENKSYIRIR